jgi:hypothetical protein
MDWCRRRARSCRVEHLAQLSDTAAVPRYGVHIAVSRACRVAMQPASRLAQSPTCVAASLGLYRRGRLTSHATACGVPGGLPLPTVDRTGLRIGPDDLGRAMSTAGVRNQGQCVGQRLRTRMGRGGRLDRRGLYRVVGYPMHTDCSDRPLHVRGRACVMAAIHSQVDGTVYGHRRHEAPLDGSVNHVANKRLRDCHGQQRPKWRVSCHDSRACNIRRASRPHS